MNALPFLLALILPVLPGSAPRSEPERNLTENGAARHEDPDDADEDGDSLVALSMIGDHDALVPGGTITLALRCKIKPRWHVYWGPNAGDSGLAFKADVTGPEGYVVGTPRFPWPKRDVSEGDIVQYLHEGELVILVDVKVPESAKVGANATFDVAARWLACTSVCLPGSGKTSLSLPVAATSKPNEAAVFAAARARLPRPWSELGRVLMTPAGEGAERKLTLVVPGATALEFFPYLTDATTFTGRKIEVGKQGGTVAMNFEFKKKHDGDVPRASGVLWVKTDKGESSYELEYKFQP